MKWVFLFIWSWILLLALMTFYFQNQTACENLGGQYLLTNGHYSCQKELP